MSPARRGALAALLLGVCALGGCGTAREVVIGPHDGCVAIAENSDVWPLKYRTKALELIKKRCPDGYEIVREEEVYTGPVIARGGTPVSDRTEWRIYYHKLGGPAPTAPVLAAVPPRPTESRPIVPVRAVESRPAAPESGLPREPVPVQ
jgi:hypothetical protein